MQAITIVPQAYQIKRDPDNLDAIKTPIDAVKNRPVYNITGCQTSRTAIEAFDGTVDLYHPKHVKKAIFNEAAAKETDKN